MIDPDTPTPVPLHFRARTLVVATVTAALATLALAALLTNIFERQQEARTPFYRVVELTDSTTDPAVWGQNFPLQYDDYLRTVDMTRTRYGGSEAMPRHPTASDPRDSVSFSRLEEDPRLREFWAGYAFAEDFREERGHAYMLSDQIFTERQNVAPQPGTCLHCHASVYVPYTRLGDGDLMLGWERANPMPYAEAAALAEHPVSCIDCHEPTTMALRVTRPGFLNGIREVKALEGIDDYDVNADASRQEMRSFVCGQCHVEYYFEGDEKRLVYPWQRGLRADSILAVYQENGHVDWTHAVSGAPALKAQHPEFELFSQGIHARSGVACADCHMPFKRTGAMKISDHWVRSPVLNLNNACQTCHTWPEAELRERVFEIQDRTFELRNVAIDAALQLTRAIGDAAEGGADAAGSATDAGGAGANPVPELAERLALARDYQRRAQFLADFIEAENSMGFHAPQEAMRILGHAINFARLGQAALAGAPLAETDPAAHPASERAVSPGEARGLATGR
ncbi:MAG: ammonia-forming cytochrome c nitrite reductase subunit c552 [Longimicrobiales bacterium]|nr:ammonia-forming cytochrome c nitrite reductase subunit c552 [Longimicrobiales bacterium]